MKAIITLPSKIKKPEFNGCCSEIRCTEEPTHYCLMLELEEFPVEFFLTLCEKHLDELVSSTGERRMSTVEIE